MSHTQQVPAPHVIVLFGATGDLAARKLLPGLFHLQVSGLMPIDYRIVGASRRASSDESFRAHATEVVTDFGRTPARGPEWEQFAARTSLVPFSTSDMTELGQAVSRARDELGPDVRTLVYLSIPAQGMPDVIAALPAAGLDDPATRVILEKPFGTDLDSARHLDALLHTILTEDQIFRIDHFLGKEDVQNILALRFGNRFFEPLWNAEHVARIEIDAPETLGVENRAAFYEETGAFRDMVVTHLLQALGFVAMEPPAAFSADALAAGRRAVFDALAPVDPSRVVRGQYAGYREHAQVADDSDTETFVALEVRIDNPRWAGVPILLRTGKHLSQSRNVITLTLRPPDYGIFSAQASLPPNQLSFEVGRRGGLRVRFRAKKPGPTMELASAEFDLPYVQQYNATAGLEAYERLLHDAMLGDHTLFNTSGGIERLWEVGAPLLADPPPVVPYESGSWGPAEADALAAPDGWALPDGHDD